MEKKVSFSVVEAMQRTTDSVERLALLMDKMDTKLDRREDQYRLRVYQGKGRGHKYRQNNYGSRNRSYSRDWYQNNYCGRRNYNKEVAIEIIDSIIETTVGPEIGTVTEMVTGIPIDQTTEEKIVIKGMITEIMIGVEIEIEIGGTEAVPEKAPASEEVPKTDMKIEGRVGIILEIETGLSLDLDPLLI